MACEDYCLAKIWIWFGRGMALTILYHGIGGKYPFQATINFSSLLCGNLIYLEIPRVYLRSLIVLISISLFPSSCDLLPLWTLCMFQFWTSSQLTRWKCLRLGKALSCIIHCLQWLLNLSMGLWILDLYFLVTQMFGEFILQVIERWISGMTTYNHIFGINLLSIS